MQLTKRLSFLLLGSLISFMGYAQFTLPTDPNVRIGQLDNGLTYYIRHNALPENRADFYIAQKVGSIQEKPEQRGLAHFLEHMCFNGTTHFPGNTLIEYLESIGVKFGENLNAYTSIDETVYNISNVPVTREGAIDSCLLILHDWSNSLLLDETEIDNERGVIHEEWRTRRNAAQRFQEKMLPVLYKDTKYEDCLPIGNMEVVLNFDYQTLRDYYKDWYRPDLQGIIVVGDIDVDRMEQKIKEQFGAIPAKAADAPERIYHPVPDNEEPQLVIYQDKEQTTTQALFFNKHEAFPKEAKNSAAYLVSNYATSLIASMLDARLTELTQKENPPFIYASAYDGLFFATRTKEAFTGVVVCNEDDIQGGIRVLLEEIQRAAQWGFTESEYARAKADYLRSLESAYNEREKVKNEAYVNEYVRHFLDNEPIPGIEYEYTLMTEMVPQLPLELINATMKELITENNQALVLFGPEKEGLSFPTEEELLTLLKEVPAKELTPYEDTVSDEPLLSSLPTGGTLVSEETDAEWGITQLTLSNGVRVVLKDTDFKADEIQMKGVSLGGSSLFPTEERVNIKMLDQIISVGGLGNFSKTDLEKALAGKRASVSPYVGDKTEGVFGHCSPKDFETLMQLTYLTFTQPRKDVEAFNSYKKRMEVVLRNQEMHPSSALMDTIQQALYMGHPRTLPLKAEHLDEMDYDRILEMYHDRFKDASDFTFFLVGNVHSDSIKPLIVQYLGALPATHRVETFKDNQIKVRQGLYQNTFIKEQETPKATVFIHYNGNCPYTLKNKLSLSITDQILDIIYTEKVREEEGGTYGVGVGGDLQKYPEEKFALQISFDTDPDKKKELIAIVLNEIENLMKNGPSAENLQKVKEFMQKKHKENLKENSYWLNVMDELLFTQVDLHRDYEQTLEQITAKDIQEFARKLFSQGNRIEVSMVSPQAEKE
mgnify:CR=1 FL=1